MIAALRLVLIPSSLCLLLLLLLISYDSNTRPSFLANASPMPSNANSNTKERSQFTSGNNNIKADSHQTDGQKDTDDDQAKGTPIPKTGNLKTSTASIPPAKAQAQEQQQSGHNQTTAGQNQTNSHAIQYASSTKYSDYPFNVSTLQVPPFCAASAKTPDGLIVYDGVVTDSILEMKLLNKALGCLSKYPLNASVADEIFRFARDRRFFSNSSGIFNDKFKNRRVDVVQSKSSQRNFKRRLPWLHADDGCMVRAEFAALWAYELMPSMPTNAVYKFFLFGDGLEPKTKYSKDGRYHGWVYHMAAMIYSEEDGFLIIDPSMNPYRPMKLLEWIDEMTPDEGMPSTFANGIKGVKGFAITNRFVYWTTSNADARYSRFSAEAAFDDSWRFVSHDLLWINELLAEEWKALADLGFNPTKYLGDSPPWLEADRKL